MKHVALTGPLAWTPTIGLAALSVVLFRLARWLRHAEVHADLGE